MPIPGGTCIPKQKCVCGHAELSFAVASLNNKALPKWGLLLLESSAGNAST